MDYSTNDNDYHLELKVFGVFALECWKKTSLSIKIPVPFQTQVEILGSLSVGIMTMGIYTEVDEASKVQLKQWWLGWQKPPESIEALEYELFFDEIAYRLSQCFSDGKQFLRQYVYADSMRQRRAALRFFVDVEDINVETKAIFLDAFAEESFALKNDMLWHCIQLRYFILNRDEVEAFTHHDNQRFAAAAEMYLCYAEENKRIGRLMNCLHSANPRKREYACDVIGDESIEALMGQLPALFNDPDKNVRSAAKINFYEGDEP